MCHVIGEEVFALFICFALGVVLCESKIRSQQEKRSILEADEGSVVNGLLILSAAYITNNQPPYAFDQPVCKSNEFLCDSSCIPLKLVCNGKVDCKDGTDEHGCPAVIKRRKWHNTPLLHVCIVLGILLLIAILVLTYCWIQRKRDGDMDLLSMARHRGMSVADMSVTGDKGWEFWNDNDIGDPAIIPVRGRVKSIVNPTYGDEEFSNVDLEVDMFDDGHKLPDRTLRRSSSVTNPLYARKSVLPEIKVTNTLEDTVPVCNNEKISAFSNGNIDTNVLDNPLNENDCLPRTGSVTNPLYNDANAWSIRF